MNGSKMMHYSANACFMMLLCSISSISAEEQSNDETMPSIEFLEFLGEWETEQGEWIDPVELESEEFGTLIETTIEDEN